MDVDARIDRDQPDPTPFLDQAGQRRIAEALHDHDVAANQGAGFLNGGNTAAKQGLDVAIIAAQRLGVGFQHDQFAAAPTRHRQRR